MRVGNRTYTFDFVPKLIYAIRGGAEQYYGFEGAYPSNFRYVMSGGALTTAYTWNAGFKHNSASACYGKKSEDGKTIYWYQEAGAEYQLNSSGKEYEFLAIG